MLEQPGEFIQHVTEFLAGLDQPAVAEERP
jgi:hypothetical protein